MELNRTIKRQVNKATITTIMNLVKYTSDKNLILLTHVLERVVKEDNKLVMKSIREQIKSGHPFKDYIKRILKDTNRQYRDQIVFNLILKNFIENQRKRIKARENGSYVPYTVLISPTMRCNLRCKGCYAGEYTTKDDLPIEEIDRIIDEGKKSGVAFFTILGGEPFILGEMLDIYKKHNDTFFQTYTNGTLINENVVEKLKKVGNVIPMISLEGYEPETDSRRGKGTYKKIMEGMDLLRKNGIPFGNSIMVTKHNYKLAMSDKFIDMLIKKGSYVVWYFLYMPVGRKPDPKLMPTPKQRAYMRKRRDYIRNNKPIFIIDFWNDAEYVGGCIAGKEYFHINNRGDIEPCIFTHFAVDNIKGKSLKQIMDSRLFKQYRKDQPFNDNLLLPCAIIDNPDVLRKYVKKFKMKPTHPGAEKIVTDVMLMKKLDKYSKKVRKVYEPIWKIHEEVKGDTIEED